jgi:hypothetical protein
MAADPGRAQSAASGIDAFASSKARSKKICRVGIDVRYNIVRPPGFPFDGNPAVAAVAFKKRCKGVVLASFTSEVDADEDNQFIAVDAKAICKGNGGYSKGCAKGAVKQSEPEFYDLALVSSATGSYTADFVWRGLKRGKWRFVIVAAGDGKGAVKSRKLRVEAYKGG